MSVEILKCHFRRNQINISLWRNIAALNNKQTNSHIDLLYAVFWILILMFFPLGTDILLTSLKLQFKCLRLLDWDSSDHARDEALIICVSLANSNWLTAIDLTFHLLSAIFVVWGIGNAISHHNIIVLYIALKTADMNMDNILTECSDVFKLSVTKSFRTWVELLG